MKNKKWLCPISYILIILILITSSINIYADSKKEDGTIILNWDEFKSMLNIDKNEIVLSWGEFTQILQQTGVDVKPQYNIKNGNVVLSREEFKKLINNIIPIKTHTLIPPGDYLIRKSKYMGIVGNNSTAFNAFLDIEIFKKNNQSYLKIPLFRDNLAIKDIRINGKPVIIITEGGWHYLSTNETGKHSINAKFSINASVESGKTDIYFNIQQTPITEIQLTIPKTNIDINILNAEEMELTSLGKNTIIKAFLLPTSNINIKWNKKVKKVERGPAKIYSELFNLLSIEVDAIRVTTKVKLNIVQNTINSISLMIPDEYEVLGVQNIGRGTWNIREEGKIRLLDIVFEYPIEGNQSFIIKTEKILPENIAVANFNGFKVIKSTRESGYFAGEVKGGVDAEAIECEGAERIAFQKIPYELTSLSSKPILFVFKYIRHPYNVTISIKKYKREKSLSAIIEKAKYISLFEENGKTIHHLTFTMQNLWNQFLKIKLPKQTSIWSVYVNGKREKPSKDNSGVILIPLIRSQKSGDGSLQAFDVEIIYTEPQNKFSVFGKRNFDLPVPDVLINSLEWCLYLPENYNYTSFSGDLKRQIITKPKPLIMTDRITKELVEDETSLIMEDIAYGESPKKKGMESGKMEEKQLIMTGEAGLLSVRVNIPLSGEKHTFVKKIIESGEALHFGLNYINKTLINIIIIVIILIIIFILFLIRGIYLSKILSLYRATSRLMPFFIFCYKPRILPIALLLLFIIVQLLDRVFYIYNHLFLLPIIIIFLLILSLIRLFKKVIIIVLKVLWQPVVFISTMAFVLLSMILADLFIMLWPLFLLFIIGFIVSIIRLLIWGIKILKKKNSYIAKDAEKIEQITPKENKEKDNK
ncbi:hypothetical protein KAU15_00135 [candidate division WOR-3 bacterium]|nr:hypothetical protein [candidate division WOR-3 bacterium]